jgi:serine/threonine-protein kinase
MTDPQSPRPQPVEEAAPQADTDHQATLPCPPDGAASAQPTSPAKTEPDRRIETIHEQPRTPVDSTPSPDATIDQGRAAESTPSPGATIDQRRAADPPASPRDTIDQPTRLRDTITPDQAQKNDMSFSLQGVKAVAPRSSYKEVAGYEIIQVLGRGAMGVVYKARQRNLNRLVALKMVLAGEHAGPQEMARFQTEALAAAELKHPNIVQVYHLGEHDGLPFLSLEYVEGGSLREKLQGRLPLDARTAALLMQILAHAMDHAHRHHIIHRDLKPANVLMAISEEQGESIQRSVTGSPVSFEFKGVHWIPKIADFGLAKRLEASDEQTNTGTVLGTALYMPPEQAEGRSKEVGPLGDQYALGVILYELVTGKPPFHGDTVWETLEQVRKQEPVPPSRLQPKLPRDLEIICLRCLQKDPQKRYETTAAMAEDLRRFLAGEPIKARPVSNFERFTRWCRRNPRVAALTGAVFFLLLSAAVGASIFAYVLNLRKNEIDVARKEAVASEQEAKDQAQKAEAARKVATEQADLALGTFGTFATEVQTHLADRPGTAELRQNILQTLAAIINKLSISSEKAALSQRTLAAARYQMATLLRELGKLEDALKEYELARSILAKLAKEEPESDKARGNMALVLSSLGDVASKREDMARARQYYEQGLAMRKAIVEHPRSKDLTPEEARRSLAESYSKLAIISGPPRERESYARKALELQAALVAKEPDNASLKADLASSKLLVGNALLEQGQVDQADPLLTESVRLRDQFAKRFPHSVAAQRNLAIALETLGNAYLLSKKPLPAKTQYLNALAIYQKLQLAEPGKYLDETSRAHYRVATAQLALNESKASAQSYAESLKVREAYVRVAGGTVGNLTPLMMVQARCGKYKTASETAGKIQNHPLLKKNPERLFDVACCYALCSAAVTNGNTASEFTGRAVGALRDAVNYGYDSLFNIQTDPDLEPIRSSPQYLALLKELKQSLDKKK